MKSFPCIRLLVFGFVVVFAAYNTASACNIPVFRYALERWTPDSYRVLVFHNGKMGAEGQKAVSGFEKLGLKSGGTANIDVKTIDLGKKLSETDAALWKTLRNSSPKETVESPYVVIQMPRGNEQFVNCWRGTLKDASTLSFDDSPARQKIAKRLLTGDSAVWLIVKSTNEKKNIEAKKLLQNELSVFAKQLRIPEGVGAPGSELFSEVPLFIKFSVMEIDPSDAKESFFSSHLINLQKKSYDSGQPLIVPVFGKGRALEVIPLEQLDRNLVGDLSAFLCGACSCQVKERNPGFDLLFSTNWEKSLFEDGIRPPKTETVSPNQRTSKPELVPIPPGRKK